MKHQVRFLISIFSIIFFSSYAHADRKLALAYLTLDGIHVSDSGVIYAADGFEGTKVFYITSEGVTRDYALGLDGPIDITEDSRGNLFVTNFNSAKVSKIDTNGVVTDFANTNLGSAGITIDSNDNLYVAHYGGGGGDGSSIVKITPDGQTSVFSEGGFLEAPVVITIDEDENIYTANFNNGMII